MSFDFNKVEEYKMYLFQDWKENEVKDAFRSALNKEIKEEKENIPRLLSTNDLKERWDMNSRQSVHNQTKKNGFPAPVLEFSNGQTKLYLESEVLLFEINNPWVRTPMSRDDYSRWITKNVIYKNSN